MQGVDVNRLGAAFNRQKFRLRSFASLDDSERIRGFQSFHFEFVQRVELHNEVDSTPIATVVVMGVDLRHLRRRHLFPKILKLELYYI